MIAWKYRLERARLSSRRKSRNISRGSRFAEKLAFCGAAASSGAIKSFFFSVRVLAPEVAGASFPANCSAPEDAW